MVDDFGRVFTFKGRIFRQINNSKKDECLSFIQSDFFNELISKKLIPNTNISTEFDGDELILEHERILESLQHEWSFSMLKEAALKTLEINEIAAKYGFELKDAHTLNVLFKNTLPIFVDIGSFAPKKDNNEWIAYAEFLSSFVVPLLFWSENKHYIVRKLLESNFHRMVTAPMQSIESAGLLALLEVTKIPYTFKLRNKSILNTDKKNSFLWFLTRAINFIPRKILSRPVHIIKYEQNQANLSTIFPLSTIKQTIEKLPHPNTESVWQGYHNKYYNEVGQINYSDRFKRLIEIIQNLEGVNSAIDLAGNEGYFSMLISKKLNLKQIILADYDENAIEIAYAVLKNEQNNTITPLLLNFMFTPNIEGTTKRLKSDIAIALAVTHHLVLTQQFSLDAIFERLEKFSNNYVMIEFMPLGLWATGDKTYPTNPAWYTIEWFREKFEAKFDKLIEEQLEENRIVFVGKIKAGIQ